MYRYKACICNIYKLMAVIHKKKYYENWFFLCNSILFSSCSFIEYYKLFTRKSNIKIAQYYIIYFRLISLYRPRFRWRRNQWQWSFLALKDFRSYVYILVLSTYPSFLFMIRNISKIASIFCFKTWLLFFNFLNQSLSSVLENTILFKLLFKVAINFLYPL